MMLSNSNLKRAELNKKSLINNRTKMEKKRALFLLLDTETTGTLDAPFIYDIAFRVVDKKGNIYAEKAYIIKDVFNNKDLMNSAYYKEKLPLYHSVLPRVKATIQQVENELKAWAGLVTYVSAYNLAYDLKACKNTFGHDLFKDNKHYCIWQNAIFHICQSRLYREYAKENDLTTQSKKFYSSNAESVYKYLTRQESFIESHTALEDVEIEHVILQSLFTKRKKNVTDIKKLMFHSMKI